MDEIKAHKIYCKVLSKQETELKKLAKKFKKVTAVHRLLIAVILVDVLISLLPLLFCWDIMIGIFAAYCVV